MVLDFTEPYKLDPEPYPAQCPVDMQPVLPVVLLCSFLFPSHEKQIFSASLSQALVEHALPTHLLKSICSRSCFVRDFSSKLLTLWCRSHCLEVEVQHWLLRAPFPSLLFHICFESELLLREHIFLWLFAARLSLFLYCF